ncbi:imidazole glycerol phosphate synthase cyclase subunit [Kiloniella litopenaei]|uniref:imidazole glycerol phosphate synthase cyclase subunit n=1 Tax=Kiloniella litopenaei TaxID=1549748 RepID=UPI003BA8EB97
MLKKRMILCLLMDNEGVFYNSRNFQIQPIGKLNWILHYLNFDAIDELVLVNVDRHPKDVHKFSQHMKELSKYCFVPISAGGGVKSNSDFQLLLESGADKIIVNSHAMKTPDLIKEAAQLFGSQCVVVSVDVKLHKPSQQKFVVIENGTKITGQSPTEWLKELETLGAGEIFLTSLDNDGVGNGYDLELIKACCDAVNIPIIASGGVGEFPHLSQGMNAGASAVSAANVFHYIGDGLTRAKQYLAQESPEFPTFIFSTSR